MLPHRSWSAGDSFAGGRGSWHDVEVAIETHYLVRKAGEGVAEELLDELSIADQAAIPEILERFGCAEIKNRTE